MAASYPGAVKSFTTKTDLVDTIQASHMNDLQLEVTAIETELGVNPPDVDDTTDAVSAAADLALRLDHFANIIKTITGKAAWYTDPVTTIEQLETDVNAVEAVYIPDTIVDAEGDLIVADAADSVVRKPVGADNRSLRALASATGGLEWDARRYVQMTVVEYATACTVADGQAYLHIPAHLAGLDIVEVHAECIAAGTTGTMDIQLRNVTQAADILSTKITIDSAETGSDTAATPAVINAAEDDVAENDLIAVDIDVIHSSAAQGLIVTIGFA
jgi:hypothetical protein